MVTVNLPFIRLIGRLFMVNDSELARAVQFLVGHLFPILMSPPLMHELHVTLVNPSEIYQVYAEPEQ